jgi:pimeloyl-ACP methyl ester carboxylesterase
MQPSRLDIPYLLNGAFHSLASTTWGDPGTPPVLCVHGLTRTGRDFDALAEALASNHYVVCPDLPGRGRSGWLTPGALYQPPSYVVALAHLLAAIGRPVAWVGTSLGGICGMLTAAAANAPISRMVLNDIGPFIPAVALARIGEYVGAAPIFAGLDEAEDYLRRVHAPFGKLSDAQWRHLTTTGTRALPDGRLALHYDPAIAEPMREGPVQDTDIWPIWDRIELPMLVLRGAASDLLLPETLTRMAVKARTHTVPDCGHAPALMDTPTIDAIRVFLQSADQ